MQGNDNREPTAISKTAISTKAIGTTREQRRRLLAAGLSAAASLLCAGTVGALVPVRAAVAQTAARERWARELGAMDAAYRAGVAPGATAFIGSSSIARWLKLPDHFPDRRVLRHGLGGATVGDVMARFDRLAGRFQPAAIVAFAGSNDLIPGRVADPAIVLNGAKAMYAATQALPGKPPLIWIEITPTPARAAVTSAVLTANERVGAHARATPGLHVLECAHRFIHVDGMPDRSYFIDDGLHLNSAGYGIWRNLLAELFAEMERA